MSLKIQKIRNLWRPQKALPGGHLPGAWPGSAGSAAGGRGAGLEEFLHPVP